MISEFNSSYKLKLRKISEVGDSSQSLYTNTHSPARVAEWLRHCCTKAWVVTQRGFESHLWRNFSNIVRDWDVIVTYHKIRPEVPTFTFIYIYIYMDMFKNKCTLLPVFGTFKRPFLKKIIGIQNCPYDNCVQRKTIYLKKMLKLKKKLRSDHKQGPSNWCLKFGHFWDTNLS